MLPQHSHGRVTHRRELRHELRRIWRDMLLPSGAQTRGSKFARYLFLFVVVCVAFLFVFSIATSSSSSSSSTSASKSSTQKSGHLNVVKSDEDSDVSNDKFSEPEIVSVDSSSFDDHGGRHHQVPPPHRNPDVRSSENSLDSHLPFIDEEEDAQDTKRKRTIIKEAMLHAWNGYKSLAFGSDELRPVSNETNESWGGFAVTLIDALDTLLLMELDDEFAEARGFVATLSFDKDVDVSFFETTIRHLGGLLSVHALTGDGLFLDKAIDLGERLLHAFPSDFKLPLSIVNLQTGESRSPRWTKSSILAEVGTCQVEYTYLAMATNDPKWAIKPMGVLSELASAESPVKGLFPLYIDPKTGEFTSELISFGALGDSFYEYLLKTWLLTRSQSRFLRRLYLESVEAMEEYCIGTSPANSMTYLSNLRSSHMTREMDHLACFVPGMLALGSRLQTGPTAERVRSLASRLLETCVDLARRSKTGLPPDVVVFSDPERENAKSDYTIHDGSYRLRPEIIESLFYMWRVTGDQKYRDWGWEVIEPILRVCRTSSSFSGIRHVDVSPAVWDNSMPSFFSVRLSSMLTFFSHLLTFFRWMIGFSILKVILSASFHSKNKTNCEFNH